MITAIQHVPHEDMGFFETVLKEKKVPFRYVRIFERGPSGGSPLSMVNLSKTSALVVMGGPMGVYESDRYPFLLEEIRLIQESLERKIPVLGICLGAQLLAGAAGGRVYPGPTKEIGWFPVRMTRGASKDPLLGHLPSQSMAFHWHGDTFDLPKGSVLLASSAKYQHQAFRVGRNAWGLQFHLEMTEFMIRDWVRMGEENLKTKEPVWDAGEILNQTSIYLPELQKMAGKVFGQFLGFFRQGVSAARLPA